MPAAMQGIHAMLTVADCTVQHTADQPGIVQLAADVACKEPPLAATHAPHLLHMPMSINFSDSSILHFFEIKPVLM
jgi:hypothetical protein